MMQLIQANDACPLNMQQGSKETILEGSPARTHSIDPPSTRASLESLLSNVSCRPCRTLSHENVFRGACASKGSPVPLTRICPHQGRKPSKAPVWPRPLLVWQLLLQTPAAAASGAAEPECTGARSATPALQPILHVTPQLVRPVSSIAQTCMHAVDEPLSTVVLLQWYSVTGPALHQLQAQAQLCQNVQGPANPRNAASPAHAAALMASCCAGKDIQDAHRTHAIFGMQGNSSSKNCSHIHKQMHSTLGATVRAGIPPLPCHASSQSAACNRSFTAHYSSEASANLEGRWHERMHPSSLHCPSLPHRMCTR